MQPNEGLGDCYIAVHGSFRTSDQQEIYNRTVLLCCYWYCLFTLLFREECLNLSSAESTWLNLQSIESEHVSKVYTGLGWSSLSRELG